ncbi:MAG: hypothetical protein HC895_14175, partial [Leptolyngbyaceae cyanobacterium SM1_3_5]|nr:hypothetical protein [Leptolyngbyaceae cyanobacterium SM1_3_5]
LDRISWKHHRSSANVDHAHVSPIAFDRISWKRAQRQAEIGTDDGLTDRLRSD